MRQRLSDKKIKQISDETGIRLKAIWQRGSSYPWFICVDYYQGIYWFNNETREIVSDERMDQMMQEREEERRRNFDELMAIEIPVEIND